MSKTGLIMTGRVAQGEPRFRARVSHTGHILIQTGPRTTAQQKEKITAKAREMLDMPAAKAMFESGAF